MIIYIQKKKGGGRRRESRGRGGCIEHARETSHNNASEKEDKRRAQEIKG